MGAGRGLRKPRALRPGSLVGVCAPAGPLAAERIDAGVAWWEAQGFRVRCAPHLRERRGYLAGDDAARAGDLRALLSDPEVACIVAARGGYGISRILRDLEPGLLRETRALLVGYSDTTALSLALLQGGALASVHGPMLERTDLSPAAGERLLALLRGEPAALEPLAGEPLATGRARGPLVGGNLKMLTASLGTPWEIQTDGAILFFEEIGEQPYAIDRALVQLRDAGKLAAAAGVAVGQLVDCSSERYPETRACDVLRDVLVPAVSGPVVAGLPFGHVADNRALGVGVPAELDGAAGTLALLEAVVEDA